MDLLRVAEPTRRCRDLVICGAEAFPRRSDAHRRLHIDKSAQARGGE
jgi:hypothetical protein